MKKLQILFGALIYATVLCITPVAVFAESGSGSGTTTATTTTTSTSGQDETTPETKLTPEQEAQRAADMKKRLEENKAALKNKLTTAKTKIITSKCKVAQSVVKGAETSAIAITANRSKAHSIITEKIQNLIDKVKTQGIDTTALEAANNTAKQKADALSASMKEYQQTLSDLRQMDCAVDPTGFQATLEKARSQRETVKNQAKDLRNYISTTLKDALKAVKQQLQSKETQSEKPDGSQGDNTTTTTTGGTR